MVYFLFNLIVPVTRGFNQAGRLTTNLFKLTKWKRLRKIITLNIVNIHIS